MNVAMGRPMRGPAPVAAGTPLAWRGYVGGTPPYPSPLWALWALWELWALWDRYTPGGPMREWCWLAYGMGTTGKLPSAVWSRLL